MWAFFSFFKVCIEAQSCRSAPDVPCGVFEVRVFRWIMEESFEWNTVTSSYSVKLRERKRACAPPPWLMRASLTVSAARESTTVRGSFVLFWLNLDGWRFRWKEAEHTTPLEQENQPANRIFWFSCCFMSSCVSKRCDLINDCWLLCSGSHWLV